MHHFMAERIHHAWYFKSIHVCNSRRECILYCSARRHEGRHSGSKSGDLCTNGSGNHISDQYHDRISALYASDRFDDWIKKRHATYSNMPWKRTLSFIARWSIVGRKYADHLCIPHNKRHRGDCQHQIPKKMLIKWVWLH